MSLRGMMREPESNRHGLLRPEDFKSTRNTSQHTGITHGYRGIMWPARGWRKRKRAQFRARFSSRQLLLETPKASGPGGKPPSLHLLLVDLNVAALVTIGPSSPGYCLPREGHRSFEVIGVDRRPSEGQKSRNELRPGALYQEGQGVVRGAR